jgi:hypothetical protein
MYISDEHARDILATIPSRMMAKGDRARLERLVLIELNEIIGTYHVLNTRREEYPFAKERKRWRQIDKLTEQLAKEMRKLRRETPWSDPDPWLPKNVLAVLRDIHLRAQARLKWLDKPKAFRATQNPYREALYCGVLRVWTEHLNGQLQYSRNRQGKPTGPLVRFLTACVEPILDQETPRAGVADIIERERNRRSAPTPTRGSITGCASTRRSTPRLSGRSASPPGSARPESRSRRSSSGFET